MRNITRALSGQVVEWVATDEKVLVIGCKGGKEVKIRWGEGGPELDGVNSRILLPPAVMTGRVQSLGGKMRRGIKSLWDRV